MQEDFRPPSVGVQFCPQAFESDAYSIAVTVSEDPMFNHALCQYMFSVVADKTQLVHFRVRIINEVLRISRIGEELALSVVETRDSVAVRDHGGAVGGGSDIDSSEAASADTDPSKCTTEFKTLLNHVTWCALSLTTDRYFADTHRLSGCNLDEIEKCKFAWYELIALAFLPSSVNRRLDIKVLTSWSESFLKLHKYA